MYSPNLRRIPRWRVLKFGGTSVASAARWACIEVVLRRRISQELSVVLVCSAVAGVTDLLAALVLTRRQGGSITALLERLRNLHDELGAELGIDASEILAGELQALETLLEETDIDARIEASVMAKGELMSTRLGAAWLSGRDLPCAWIDVRTLLTADPCEQDDDKKYLAATCSPVLDEGLRAKLGARAQVVITQGFVANSPSGETVVLGRGGSDTSAAYLACLLGAERLEIWTDVPGLFTANPRLIPEARLLRRIGYRAAQALGALGAKALHPRAIEAVWEHGIPVAFGWTERPDVEGTHINAARASDGIKAITSRRKLAMFSMRRPPSWQPVGFLAEVAACFASRGLSMDLVSSSCSEIRVTLDLAAFPAAEAKIPEILRELEPICQARVIMPVASVSIVGKNVSQALLSSGNEFGLSEEALLMVVHAANEHHVSLVLDEESAELLVARAHQRLIETTPILHDLGPTWTELIRPGKDGRGQAA